MPVLNAKAYAPADVQQSSVQRNQTLVVTRLFFLIAPLKALLLIVDPTPAFHFGDSGAYLATALAKWIPPDRSFTYGFLIRPLVLRSHSLIPLILLQTALSTAAAILLGLLLVRYFQLTFKAAAFFAVLCAIEPLQLMSERFVMTEAFATFGFSIFIWACMEFLKNGTLWILALLQLVGVLLMSLRYSFLPLLLVMSIALPLMWAGKRVRWQWKPTILRLVIALLVSQSLLSGYRHLYGSIEHTRPAYLSRDGDFLIADMAPLVTPEDFPIPQERAALFQKITIPLNIDSRRLHRWVSGGICDAILQTAHGDEDVANQLARKMALRAMRRNPLGALRLALGTYREFLDFGKVEWALQLDQGQFVSPTADDVAMIKRWFDIDARDRHFDSMTKRWEGLAVPWCWLFVILPLFYVVEIVINWRRSSNLDLLLLLTAAVLLFCAVVPVEIANPRYLTPIPWLSILILGVMYSRLNVKSSQKPTAP